MPTSARMPGCPEPGPGCRGGRPLPAAREPERARLLERRERGWQQDLVLLRQKPIGSPRRRPDARLPGVVPHSGALIEARVGPDVYEPIGAAELDAAGKDDGRELCAFGELRLPPGRHVGQRTGLQRVVTQLEDRPDLPGADLGHEPERNDDLRAHRADELANLGRPVRVLRRLAPDARALAEALDIVRGPAYLSPHSSWGRFRLDLYTLEPWGAVRDLARDRPSTDHALVPRSPPASLRTIGDRHVE